MTDVTPPPAPEPTPAPAAPAAPAYSTPPASDGKTLGIIALVSAFFIALLGVILGFVAKGQSKRAGVKNTPATVAIVLGFVFMAVYIIIGIVAAVGFSSLLAACAGLAPGEYILETGGTITCG